MRINNFVVYTFRYRRATKASSIKRIWNEGNYRQHSLIHVLLYFSDLLYH